MLNAYVIISVLFIFTKPKISIAYFWYVKCMHRDNGPSVNTRHCRDKQTLNDLHLGQTTPNHLRSFFVFVFFWGGGHG